MRPLGKMTLRARARPPAATRATRRKKRSCSDRPSRRRSRPPPPAASDDGEHRAARRRPKARPKMVDETVEAKASEESSDASPLSGLEFGLGFKALFRNLAWTPDGRDAGLGPYSLSPGPQTGLWLEFYPAAFGSSGFAANIGVIAQLQLRLRCRHDAGERRRGRDQVPGFARGCEAPRSVRRLRAQPVHRLRPAGVRDRAADDDAGPAPARLSVRAVRARGPHAFHAHGRAGCRRRLPAGPRSRIGRELHPGPQPILPQGDGIRLRRHGVPRVSADRLDRGAGRSRPAGLHHQQQSRPNHPRRHGRGRSLHHDLGRPRGGARRPGRGGRRRRRRARQAVQAKAPPRLAVRGRL